MICSEEWKLSGRGATYLVELDYVGMSNFLKNFDFPGDAFYILLVVDFLLLENFDGHLDNL